MKNCVKCNAVLENDAEFCGECGERQPVVKTMPTCPNCGTSIEEGAEFCPECGQKIINSNSSLNSHDISESSTNKFSELTKKPNVLGGVAAAVVAIIVAAYFLFAGNVIEVKADDMIDDYIRDQSTAEQKYKGKDIAVTGTLLVKTQFGNSQDYNMVIASKTAGKVYSISLIVASKNVKAVNSVNYGDFVSAKGKCIGIVPQKDPTDISVQIQADSVNE